MTSFSRELNISAITAGATVLWRVCVHSVPARASVGVRDASMREGGSAEMLTGNRSVSGVGHKSANPFVVKNSVFTGLPPPERPLVLIEEVENYRRSVSNGYEDVIRVNERG